MLYKLTDGNRKLEPVRYLNLADLGQVEKDLEDLLAKNLLDVLFEESPLMPFFQERKRQAEADLYAIDSSGDLFIFELKRIAAGSDAALQVLRYAQEAGTWTFNTLQDKYRKYCKRPSADLAEDHRNAFALGSALGPQEFNSRQRLFVIGSSADEKLRSAVDYWKRQGLAVDFLPYRIYELKGEQYFEFFSPPYDHHLNPSAPKGVLFDTNRSYNEDALWEMMEKKRVAAYGEATGVVDLLNLGDIVFYYHRGVGVVAAARVTDRARNDGPKQRYCEVEFLTPVPTREQDELKKLTPAEVSGVTGKAFYWPRTVKVPHLSEEESIRLLAALQSALR